VRVLHEHLPDVSHFPASSFAHFQIRFEVPRGEPRLHGGVIERAFFLPGFRAIVVSQFSWIVVVHCSRCYYYYIRSIARRNFYDVPLKARFTMWIVSNAIRHFVDDERLQVIEGDDPF
jgi:hypothetical protein